MFIGLVSFATISGDGVVNDDGFRLEGVMHLRPDDARLAVWNAKLTPVMSRMTSGP